MVAEIFVYYPLLRHTNRAKLGHSVSWLQMQNFSLSKFRYFFKQSPVFEMHFMGESIGKSLTSIIRLQGTLSIVDLNKIPIWSMLRSCGDSGIKNKGSIWDVAELDQDGHKGWYHCDREQIGALPVSVTYLLIAFCAGVVIISRDKTGCLHKNQVCTAWWAQENLGSENKKYLIAWNEC